MAELFHFRQFSIDQSGAAFKVGTDGVLLGAWAELQGAASIVDIGTGTGLIALMAAQQNPEARVEGLEQDAGAAERAAYNFAQSPWSDRLQAFALNWAEWLERRKTPVDHFLCNPPFFTSGARASNEAAARARHVEDLDAASLFAGARRMLSADGRISLVFPAEQEEKWLQEAALQGLYPRRICRVRPRQQSPVERVLLECGPQVHWRPLRSELVLLEPEGYVRSAAYARLTEAFYRQ